MDLSGLHLLDPVVIDSVRDTLFSAHDHVVSAAHSLAAAWTPDAGHAGAVPHHGFGHLGHGDHGAVDDGRGQVDLAEAPAEKPGEKPPTTPPDKKIVEGSIERKDAPALLRDCWRKPRR